MAIADQKHAGKTASPAQLLRTRRAVRAGFFGSMLEYYDYVIYGSAAALVFNKVFFPEAEATAGVLLSLATFGVAYAAKPFGAIILGHFGDRIGRKRVMMFTVVLMGACTFLIGFLPDFNTIGVAAPALLVLLRLCQGLSSAGEQSGAAAIILETAPLAKRGYYSSFVMSGTVAGTILGTAVFIPIATMPEEALLAWGWRIPFLLSVVVVALAYFLRRYMEEPTAFAEVKNEHRVAKLPLIELFRTHPWAVLRLMGCAITAAVGSIFTVFSVAYAINATEIERPTMLILTTTANILALITVPLFAALSDRIGRKPVFLGGTVASAIMGFVFFYSLSTQILPFIFIAGYLFYSVAYGAIISLVAFYPEMFSTTVRYSGSSVGMQLGYVLIGFAPTIGYAILQPGINGWIPVAIMVAVICAISFIAAAAGRETYRDDISALGSRKALAEA